MIPDGFLLVVGYCVVLLAVLAILILAWLYDAAKSLRAIAQTAPRPAGSNTEPEEAA